MKTETRRREGRKGVPVKINKALKCFKTLCQGGSVYLRMAMKDGWGPNTGITKILFL
jgi:hypothetical protein